MAKKDDRWSGQGSETRRERSAENVRSNTPTAGSRSSDHDWFLEEEKRKDINRQIYGKSEEVAPESEQPVATNQRTVREWVSYISEPYTKAKDNLIETGSRLVQAEHQLEHEKLTEVYAQLGFGNRRAQQLKDLYRYFGEFDTGKLPSIDRALNQLKKFEKHQLQQAIDEGEIHQGLKTEDAQAVVQRYRGDSTEEQASAKKTNYHTGQLRRLATMFETVEEAEVEEIVGELDNKERARLKRTIQVIERYIEAGGDTEGEQE